MPEQTQESVDFNSPSFELPIEYALDFHLEKNPNHTAVTHPIGFGEGFESYTYSELVPAIHRTGQFISATLNLQIAVGSVAPVVAILLKTDTMMYLTTIAGLMRAGFTPFPISSRFSPTVVAHLLKESQPAGVIISDATRDLAIEALKDYTGGDSGQPILCDLPPFSSLYPGHNKYTPLPKHERKPESTSILLHSSSTSSIFPKLIPWSSVFANLNGEIKDMPIRQLAGKVVGCFGLELFHSYGMCLLFSMVRQGLVLAFMDPGHESSVLPVDMNDVYNCFKITQPSMLLANPRAIELWADDPEKVAEFRASGVSIFYGGRFLSKSVGDKLVRSGVKIAVAYGATECGGIALFPHFQGEDWEYFTIYPRPDVNFVSRGDGLFELFVAPTGEVNYLASTNTTWNEIPAYNPGDLFIPHPSKPHTYKMFGRSSDQIMLATGEMVNPIEIEEELSRHPLVSAAVMFGHTRFRVGIVIEAAESLEENTPQTFLNEIWSVIEGINKKSPSYSHITREMTIVSNTKKPISMSPKGLPRRPIVWLEYQDEIDALYAQDLRTPK